MEVVARPGDLRGVLDGLAVGAKTIPVDGQGTLLAEAAGFLMSKFRLVVDGREVETELDRINFLRRTLRSSTVIDPPEELSIHSATIGAIFAAPLNGLPKKVEVPWDFYPAKAARVGAASVDEAGPLPSSLSKDDPVLVWKNFLKNPTVPTLVQLDPPRPVTIQLPLATLGLGLAGLLLLIRPPGGSRVPRGMRGRKPAAAALVLAILLWPFARVDVPVPGGGLEKLDAAKAEQVMHGLLRNIYMAFDYRDESSVYDTLAHSVSGDLLSDIYVQTRQSLVLRSQGGARVKVTDVEIEEAESEREGSRRLKVRCRWKVTGKVGHWGHIHRRTNRYNADFILEANGDTWKIVEQNLTQSERLG